MQEQKQELSLGITYSNKLMTGIIAVDFLFLPILLTMDKHNQTLFLTLDAFCFSLSTAGGYFLVRLGLENNKRKWNVLNNHLPICSLIFKLFLFEFLPWSASISCFAAVIGIISYFSSTAFLVLILPVSFIFTFLCIFDVVTSILLIKKNIKIPPSDS